MTETPFDFSGKVALVTGASRGIGAAIATALGRAGARCAVNYVADPDGRNEADARAVAAGLPGAIVVEADVSRHDPVGAMFDRVRGEFGGLDILVNNAGILRDRSLKKITPADWDAVIGVNLTGAFNCLRHAAPLLRPGGRVVNVASVSAVVGIFGQANYAASKAGLLALTRVAAAELAKNDVTVNAVAPGVVETEILRDMPAEAKARFLESVPLRRAGTVEDIAGAVMFLCSPLAAYITGQVLHVNGGFYMG